MEATGSRMTGVRIRIGGAPRPPGSYFAAFFGPVLTRLRGLVFLVDDQAVHPPYELPAYEWEAFAARRRRITASGDGWLTGCFEPHYACDPAFVPDYAEWVNDDDCDLYGFDSPPADWRVWLRAGRFTGAQWKAERAEYLSSTTAVCFFAVDYAYWEFFAHDAALVRAVSEAAAASRLVVQSAALAESVGL